MRAGLVQLTSSDDPVANLPETLALIREAAAAGADLIVTPEVTNCVSASRDRQRAVLATEDEDVTLAALRSEARALGRWIVAGSLALKTHGGDGRFVNRCFVISPEGEIAARYDKIHMFDVTIDATETYRESDGYRPGDRAALVEIAGTKVGLTICYDLRFPHLFRALANAGAQVILVPSAFSPVTGEAHWEPLLRARAIECGAYILAPAQTGAHPATEGRVRRTHGHGLAVSPWGRVLRDMGVEKGVTVLDLDLAEVEQCRRSIPSLSHDRPFEGP